MYLVKSNYVKLSLVFMLILSAVTFAIGSVVDASENDEKTADGVTYKEFSEETTFMYDEAIMYDENNSPLGVNFDKVKDRHGTVPQEYTQLDNDIKKTREKAKEQQPRTSTRAVGDGYKDRWDCNAKELVKQTGSSLPPAVLTAVVDYWNQGKKGAAFKKIVKAGVKGNAVGIAYTIISTDIQCVNKYGY